MGCAHSDVLKSPDLIEQAQRGRVQYQDNCLS
jgi:hypothetical protein